MKRPQAPVPLVCLPALLAGPDPSAVLNRPDFVAAASTLLTIPRIRLPPALRSHYDDPGIEGLTPPTGRTAPRGALEFVGESCHAWGGTGNVLRGQPMRDTRPPADLRQSKARITAIARPTGLAAGSRQNPASYGEGE